MCLDETAHSCRCASLLLACKQQQQRCWAWAVSQTWWRCRA